MSSFDPIISIKKFSLADLRAGLSRIPGMMLRIINTFPNLTGEERTRPGYSSYASTDGGSSPGQDMPTGFEVLKTLPIQNPASDDVHLKFANNGGQAVFMNPWYQISARQATDMRIDENLTFTGTTSSITAHQINFNAVGSLNTTTDYYTNWLMKNNTRNSYGLVTAYSFGSSINSFTILEQVNAGGLNWQSGDSFTLYRSFHDNPTFAPTYNTDLANQIACNVENSIIRFSGGQGSSNGLRGIWINPKLNKTFFPGAGTSFTYTGTYVSEREVKALSILNAGPGASKFNWVVEDGTHASNRLEPNRTLWFASAPVYDGFQEGPLTTYETSSDWNTVSGPQYATINNFLKTNGSSSAQDVIDGVTFYLSVSAAQLNKRITGFAIYVAIDIGQTTARVADYQFVRYYSIITTGADLVWALTSVGGQVQVYAMQIEITNSLLSAALAGNTFQEDSGYVKGSADLMYSYSSEEIVGTRRFLSNAYVSSEAFTDRENVFTNPVGGNAQIGNAGVIQPDVFSNEQPTYRMRVDPTVGTKINGLVSTGVDEFICLKDRGLVLCRVITIGTLPNLMLTVVNREVGASTLNAFTKDDVGRIYFPSSFDIYRYIQGQIEKLIEREDKNDWLDTYRNTISDTDKQNVTCVYLPEVKGVLFQFANQAASFEQKQYIYFPNYESWREIRFNESSGTPNTSFKYFCKLANGQTLGVTSATPAVKRLMWKYSSVMAQYLLTYIDGATPIAPFWDTGDFVVQDGRDLKFNKLHILKTIDSPPQGQLDCELYLDGSLVRTYTSQSMQDVRLIVNGLSDDIRIGYTFRFRYNVNTNNRERLNAGNQLQFDGIMLYGDTIPHFRVTENTGTLNHGGGVPILGTIAGKRELTITTANVAQTFTFDIPFTETYIGSLATEPAYRFNIDSAHPVVGGVEDTTTSVSVTIISRTLTTITLESAEDLTIVRYSIA